MAATGLPQDAASCGQWAGRSLGAITFRDTQAYAVCTLGFFTRGHNYYMETARASSDALAEWYDALMYYFPFLDRNYFKVHRVDATYQLKVPDYKRVAFLLSSYLCNEQGKSGRGYKVHFDPKTYGIFGQDRKTRKWSCYDKYLQVFESQGLDIPELAGIMRLTERVERGDKSWDALWESNDERTNRFSQEGLLRLFSRWETTLLLDTAVAGESRLYEKYDAYDITTALYLLEHPEHTSYMLGKLKENKSSQAVKKQFDRRIRPILDDLRKSSKQRETFTINIPSASIYVKHIDCAKVS